MQRLWQCGDYAAAGAKTCERGCGGMRSMEEMLHLRLTLRVSEYWQQRCYACHNIYLPRRVPLLYVYTITESLTHKDYFDTKKCFVLNIN